MNDDTKDFTEDGYMKGYAQGLVDGARDSETGCMLGVLFLGAVIVVVSLAWLFLLTYRH